MKPCLKNRKDYLIKPNEKNKKKKDNYV